MKHNVEKGKTLLVDGPASVTFLSGEVEVLGGSLVAGEKNGYTGWKALAL